MFNHKLKEGKRTLERESLDIQTGKEETRKEGAAGGERGREGERGERERERDVDSVLCVSKRERFLSYPSF